MSTTETQIKPELLAHDLKTLLADKVDSDKMQEITSELESTDMKAYPAKGNIVSLIFYTKMQVYLDQGGKQFEGHAGSIGTPGGGATFGHVYTKDLNYLQNNTTGFTFYSSPVYFAIYFFDKHQSLIGSFQAAAISIVSGTGGGSGSWS